jgi:hypothetical protein
MVVQMENVGADFVDLAEQPVGGVAGEHVGQARLHAHPGQREPASPLPLTGECELLVAELDSGPAVRLGRVGLRQRHRHVQVVRARLQRGPEQGHDEARIGGVEQDVTAL